MYWIGGFLLLVFGIPNTTNFKERRAFSDERRLEEAMVLYPVGLEADSVTVIPGSYYGRSKLANLFLGKKQRALWTEPVRVPVFSYTDTHGGMEPFEVGGGEQTISIKLKDPQDRKWALRSMNKDQKSALPRFFRWTFLRFLIRDQVASANPYGQLAVPALADAIGIHYTNPQLYLIPYDESQGDYNVRMAGRLAYLEENLNSSWKNRERFGSPKDIVNTEEMLEMQQEEVTPIDTLLFLKSRLFDMLISDWDRHEGNWEWALSKEKDGRIFEPIPKDRDNAFFQFDEGLVSHITLIFVPKFQSFRKDFGKVSGLMHQSRELDRNILSGVKRERFKQVAEEIRQQLTSDVIENAFRRYPPNVYKLVGEEHQEILEARLQHLPEAALEFYNLLRK